MALLHDQHGEPFEIPDEDVLLNDPILPGEFNPHNVTLWLIGHEFGPVVAVWASNESDALDEMLNQNYEHFLVEDPEEDPDGDKYTYLGNAGEPCNLDYAWVKRIHLDPARDFALCIQIAEKRALGDDTLGD